jgi:hypothetical protein
MNLGIKVKNQDAPVHAGQGRSQLTGNKTFAHPGPAAVKGHHQTVCTFLLSHDRLSPR